MNRNAFIKVFVISVCAICNAYSLYTGIGFKRPLYSSSLHMTSSYSRSLIATSILSATLNTPFGDIGTAVEAIARSHGEAILCVLDGKKADDFHDSCQLKDDVVRWRAGHIVTFKQDWGRSKSTGAAIWNGANMAAW